MAVGRLKDGARIRTLPRVGDPARHRVPEPDRAVAQSSDRQPASAIGRLPPADR